MLLSEIKRLYIFKVVMKRKKPLYFKCIFMIYNYSKIYII